MIYKYLAVKKLGVIPGFAYFKPGKVKLRLAMLCRVRKGVKKMPNRVKFLIGARKRDPP